MPTFEPSDRDLLEAFRNGQAAALEQLYARHASTVYCVAYARLRDSDATQDLVQEVFLRLLLHQGRLADGSYLAPWLVRLTRNLAIDWTRRAQVRSRLVALVPAADTGPLDGAVTATTHKSPADEVQASEEHSLLNSALDQLPDEDREIVLLHYCEGLTQQDIARRFSVHHTTVGRRLVAATQTLKALLTSPTHFAPITLSSLRRPLLRTQKMLTCYMALPTRDRTALANLASSMIEHLQPTPELNTPLASRWSSALLQTPLGTIAMKASRIIAALAATAAVIALGAYTTAQYFRSRTPAQRTNNTAAAPTFQATQQVAWDGSKTLFVPYGKQLTVETPSRNFGGTSCKIKMVITNQPGKPLHIEEVWEWSGQWVWNLSPTDTPAPGAPPSDTSMLLHTMQGGDSLLIRTIVAQSAADGMQCHIALGIAPTGGKLWSSLSSQYAEGKLRVQDLRRTLVEFFVTNQLLPAPSEPILRTRTLQYLESFTP